VLTVTSRISTYLSVAPLDGYTGPQVFLEEVVVHRDGEKRRAAARGHDIYAITAPIVVEATERILTGRVNPPAAKGGVFTAAELFEPHDFLRSLPLHLM
jgi:hypothetical protein